MKSQSPPLPVRITLNQEGTEAILHFNCQSDGRVERWLEDKEESSDQAKQVWLSKLGCLLRVHWDFECQWFDSPVELNTNTLPLDKFNDPWAYRIADFPKNYKLFAVGRQTGGDNSPREDHYLCGMFLSLFCITLLTISFQVGTMTIDLPKNFIHTCIGCSRVSKGLKKNASANTVIIPQTRGISTKFSGSHPTKKVPKDPQDPRKTRNQGNYRLPGVLLARGGWS